VSVARGFRELNEELPISSQVGLGIADRGLMVVKPEESTADVFGVVCVAPKATNDAVYQCG
jgi:hypothetical protein